MQLFWKSTKRRLAPATDTSGMTAIPAAMRSVRAVNLTMLQQMQDYGYPGGRAQGIDTYLFIVSQWHLRPAHLFRIFIAMDNDREDHVVIACP